MFKIEEVLESLFFTHAKSSDGCWVRVCYVRIHRVGLKLE